MFLSIPTEEYITLIKSLFKISQINKNTEKKLCQHSIYLFQTLLQFDNQLYTQTTQLSMESSLSSLIADTIMSDLEHNILTCNYISFTSNYGTNMWKV